MLFLFVCVYTVLLDQIKFDIIVQRDGYDEFRIPNFNVLNHCVDIAIKTPMIQHCSFQNTDDKNIINVP